MDVTFTDEQLALRAAVGDLLSDRCPITHVRDVMASETGADMDLYRALAQMGVLDLPGLVELVVALEQCGTALVPAPVLSVAGIATPALAAADPGSDLLEGTRAGEAVPVLALDVPDGDVLHLVPEAHVATHVVFPQGDELVAVAAADCDIEQLPTMDATRRLCEVRLGSAPRTPLGQAGPALEAGRLRGSVAVAAELVGVAQACLDRAVAHAKTREQFGKPIGVYQAVSHRCVDMFIATESARSHTYFAAWAVQEQTDEAHLAASQAKASAGDGSVLTAQGAIQVHGGIGMTWEADLHLFCKRARGGAALLGTPTVHRRRIAQLMGV